MTKMHSRRRALCAECSTEAKVRIVKEKGGVFLEKFRSERGISAAMHSTDVDW